jgi:hypothetical protein
VHQAEHMIANFPEAGEIFKPVVDHSPVRQSTAAPIEADDVMPSPPACARISVQKAADPLYETVPRPLITLPSGVPHTGLRSWDGWSFVEIGNHHLSSSKSVTGQCPAVGRIPLQSIDAADRPEARHAAPVLRHPTSIAPASERRAAPARGLLSPAPSHIAGLENVRWSPVRCVVSATSSTFAAVVRQWHPADHVSHPNNSSTRPSESRLHALCCRVVTIAPLSFQFESTSSEKPHNSRCTLTPLIPGSSSNR